MTGMIERVARAICEENVGECDTVCFGDSGTVFSEERKPRWQWWVPEARAAIEAMKEPTEAMLLAATRAEFSKSDSEGSWTEWPERDAVEAAWPAMISAALSEEKA